MKSVKEQLAIIKQGVVQIIPEAELEQKLEKSIRTNKPLRIKQGFDPTAPDIHLGHTVGLRKLRQFQELGHQIILIIGDYTGMVGDPSGRSAARPQLSLAEVRNNAQTYLEQFSKVLDRSQTDIHYNGEWFGKMSFQEIMRLASQFTIARMLERDDFAERYQRQTPIALHEFFYPIMQAYDSVAIQADVEIGATEQTFNLLCGRQMQQEYGQEPQIVITLPILIGTDGTHRMSKSSGNYIGVTEPADQMYGKVMSIPDEQIVNYLELTADIAPEELQKARKEIETRFVNPMIWKKRLAYLLVAMYHGANFAEQAQVEFERVFSQGESPEKKTAAHILIEGSNSPFSLELARFCAGTIPPITESVSAARRLIEQGGLSINGVRIIDPQKRLELEIGKPIEVRAGKLKWYVVIPEAKGNSGR